MRRALMLLVLAGCGTKVVDLSPPDAGPDTQLFCAIEIATDGNRCLYCKGTTLEQVACLKCEPADPAIKCQVCVWNDQPKLTCKMCKDANGIFEGEDCERLRPELPRL